jgi:molybdenum cofactor synthesis domain-containing protein
MSSELPAGARAAVVTASNRASSGVYDDRSGQALAAGLRDLGFDVDGPHVHPDDVETLAGALRAAVAAGADVVLTTGGTGLSPTDVTPEATRLVLEREAPGIAEAVRRYGHEKVPTSVLSRGLAGTAGRTLIVNLPGSTGGVKDGLAVLGPLLPHVVSQLRGGDHV